MPKWGQSYHPNQLPHQGFHFRVRYALLDSSVHPAASLPLPPPLPTARCLLSQSTSLIPSSFLLPLPPSRCSDISPGQLQSPLSSGSLNPLSPAYHSPCQRVTSPLRTLSAVVFPCYGTKSQVFWGSVSGLHHIRESDRRAGHRHTHVLPALAPHLLPSWGCSASPALLSHSHSSRPSSSLTSSLKTW